jgi:hypothetical protein
MMLTVFSLFNVNLFAKLKLLRFIVLNNHAQRLLLQMVSYKEVKDKKIIF